MRPGREAVSMLRECESHGTVEGFSDRGMRNGCVVDEVGISLEYWVGIARWHRND